MALWRLCKSRQNIPASAGFADAHGIELLYRRMPPCVAYFQDSFRKVNGVAPQFQG